MDNEGLHRHFERTRAEGSSYSSKECRNNPCLTPCKSAATPKMYSELGMNLLVRLMLTQHRAVAYTSVIIVIACTPCAKLFSSRSAAIRETYWHEPPWPQPSILRPHAARNQWRRLRRCRYAIRCSGCLPQPLRARRSWSGAPVSGGPGQSEEKERGSTETTCDLCETLRDLWGNPAMDLWQACDCRMPAIVWRKALRKPC